MAAVVNKSVGMMDDAYFVGRKVILDWLNTLCRLNLTKIEETASGAVACQVMDALFPGKVPMAKVNWGAKTDYEFVANYKVLQSVFAKLNIDRAIEVDRLIRARYQDNLEFMQWLRKFYEDNYSSAVEEYDAVGRRNKGKGVNLFKPAAGASSTSNTASKVTRPTRAPGKVPPASTKNVGAKRTSPASKENSRAVNAPSASATVAGDGKRVEQLETELQVVQERSQELEDQSHELSNINAELKLQVEGMERERDFYFGKLREVELLLQNYQGPDRNIVKEVLKVLYATEDDVDGEAALAAAEAVLADSSADDHVADEEHNEEGEEAEQHEIFEGKQGDEPPNTPTEIQDEY